MSRFASYFQQKHSEVRQQRGWIADALKAGANTVSKISQKTEMPKDLVVWNLMGMLKWGTIEVAGEENHELLYAVKEV